MPGQRQRPIRTIAQVKSEDGGEAHCLPILCFDLHPHTEKVGKCGNWPETNPMIITKGLTMARRYRRNSLV